MVTCESGKNLQVPLLISSHTRSWWVMGGARWYNIPPVGSLPVEKCTHDDQMNVCVPNCLLLQLPGRKPCCRVTLASYKAIRVVSPSHMALHTTRARLERSFWQLRVPLPERVHPHVPFGRLRRCGGFSQTLFPLNLE